MFRKLNESFLDSSSTVSECLNGVLLFNPQHKENCDLHDPINKTAEDNEGVEAYLIFTLLGSPPVRNPNSHPQEISNEREENEKHKLDVVLKSVINKIYLIITYRIRLPHEVEEGVHGQVIVSTCKAGESTEDATNFENVEEVFFSTLDNSLNMFMVQFGLHSY